VETKFVQNVRESVDGEESVFENIGSDEHIDDLAEESDTESKDETETDIDLVEPGNYALLENPSHVYQTFNNCGPATLSMILSWYGVSASQAELGNQMRPYQNPQGDNDDKTIFTYEFVDWAKNYGMEAIGRPNGDIELLKKFTANGIPVVVKTWLHPGEDIGHFRIVRGFDENKKVIIQDDSYEGPNKKFPYYDFLSMWQAFNYHYIIIYSADMQDKVEAIIGTEMDTPVAWENALNRAEKERDLDPDNIYPPFNISTAAYHLGNYERSVSIFEEVGNELPRRMLWYQIEPILAYKELGNYDRVFQITNRVLDNGNRAFSELYMIRGEIYLEKGDTEKAREQFELALQYNENFEDAERALESL
jgi:tetratricopeptide (TPR) repeat protein